MEQLYYFLLFLLPLIVGAEENPIEYHGNRRYWTSLNPDQTTHVALHILEDSVKIIFPVEKTIGQILTDMKLYSPTGNGKCQDTANTLEFKIAFDGNEKYIRGEIKVLVDDVQNLKMYMHEKCGRNEKRDYYSTLIIEDIQQKLESDGRTCFKSIENDDELFHHYGTDTAKNVLELKVTPNGFGCQVFMILPPYMYVEDVALTNNGLVKLNDSFAGHEESFWWKSENDPMLPSAVSFGAEDNVIINILNSTKAVPHFFRIGNFSSIPSLIFKFSANCVDFKSELYLNFHDEPGCRIGIQVTEHGFKFSTKGSSEWKAFKDPTKSPTVVFDKETKKVYVKVKSTDIPSITVFESCQIENLESVAADQLVVKIGPEGAVSGICDSATVTLIRKDITRPIDVLIDRTKIVQPNITTNEPKKENATTVGSAGSGDKDAKAGLEWWWILVIIVVLLVILVPGIIITYVCIRRKRKNKKPKNGGPPRSKLNHDKDQPKSPAATTAIPLESPKKKKNKKNKKKKNQKEGELDESSKTSSKKSNKKNAKPKSKSKPADREDQYQPMPSKEDLPPKPYQDYSAIQTTQTEPTTVETGSTQIASQKTVPGGTVEKVAAKHRPKFRFRSMYGAGGFGQMNEPFDYHLNEGSDYEPTINFAAAFKLTPQPELKQFDNFWSCLEPIAEAKRYSPVFVNSKLPGRNIYFMIRDCVAEESLYSPFRTLSNRMLEPIKSYPGRNKNSEPSTVDGEKKFYILRLFILSYEPLTLEIHCRGQCPLFLFSLFECEQCPEVAKRLQKNAWMNSQATCREDWDTFVCRVKRAPINSHQFLSYNGPDKPKNSEEVNHVMIIRGDKKPNKLRECKRGCTFSDMSHPNNVTIETELQGDPTLQTQVTQPSSKER